MRRHPIIVEATNVALAGMDPMEFIRSRSETEVLIMQAIVLNVADARAKANEAG